MNIKRKVSNEASKGLSQDKAELIGRAVEIANILAAVRDLSPKAGWGSETGSQDISISDELSNCALRAAYLLGSMAHPSPLSDRVLDRRRSRGISISNELSNLVIQTDTSVKGNLKIGERLRFIASYFKILEKYISERDIKNALLAQGFLIQAFYDLGLVKPLYLRTAAKRGGRADKKKRGILLALRKLWPRIGKKSPKEAWNFLKWNYPEDKPLVIEQYEIFFYDDLLFQESPEGKKSIKYKTFESLFYQIKKETPK